MIVSFNYSVANKNWSLIFLSLLAIFFPFTGAAAHNILFWLAVISFCFSISFYKNLKVVIKNPVSQLSLIIFFFMSISLIWNGYSANAINGLLKYKEFIFIALLPAAMLNKKTAQMITVFFITGLLLALIASYLIYFDLFRPNGHYNSFSGRILHGLQMNVLLLFLLYQVFIKKRNQIISIIISLLIIANITIIEPSRTAQITMLSVEFLFIVIYLIDNPIRDEIKILTIPLLFIVFTVAVFNFASIKTLTKINELPPDLHEITEKDLRNSDPRAAFYLNGLNLIAKKPITGFGLGNIEEPYQSLRKEQISQKNEDKYAVTNNLHNQFLQISVEIGVIGGLIFSIFVISTLFTEANIALKSGIFLITLISNAFNSSFLDHGDGWILLLTLSLLIAHSSPSEQIEKVAAK